MQEEQKETAAGSPVASFQTRRDKPIEVMSLQEKFIELRRQIPRIEKGQHSEEVPYKFAKIDDVWRAITPTMNELGVNFDIIQEENAQIKTMNTQHGGLMFLYESDLTMRWTNADNEDDTDEAQTHAIAWNDDPAKAKGSAWTYAIKYYLFEKFSIDMLYFLNMIDKVKNARSHVEMIEVTRTIQQPLHGGTAHHSFSKCVVLDHFQEARKAEITQHGGTGRGSYHSRNSIMDYFALEYSAGIVSNVGTAAGQSQSKAGAIEHFDDVQPLELPLAAGVAHTNHIKNIIKEE